MCHMFFIFSYVEGHLGCFHFLAVVKSTSMTIGIHVSFHIRIFIFSGYMLRNQIAGLYGNSVFILLRNFHIILCYGG